MSNDRSAITEKMIQNELKDFASLLYKILIEKNKNKDTEKDFQDLKTKLFENIENRNQINYLAFSEDRVDTALRSLALLSVGYMDYENIQNKKRALVDAYDNYHNELAGYTLLYDRYYNANKHYTNIISGLLTSTDEKMVTATKALIDDPEQDPERSYLFQQAAKEAQRQMKSQSIQLQQRKQDLKQEQSKEKKNEYEPLPNEESKKRDTKIGIHPKNIDPKNPKNYLLALQKELADPKYDKMGTASFFSSTKTKTPSNIEKFRKALKGLSERSSEEEVNIAFKEVKKIAGGIERDSERNPELQKTYSEIRENVGLTALEGPPLAMKGITPRNL